MSGKEKELEMIREKDQTLNEAGQFEVKKIKTKACQVGHEKNVTY